MEYSAEAVASATSLQIYTYIYTSVATFWTYDYVCSLHDEWTFLLRSRWTKVKGLYIATRYLPFLLLTGRLYLDFSPIESSNECRSISNICESFALISAIFSECFFILRTYALWNKNKIVLGAILTAAFAIIVTSISVLFATTNVAPFETSAIPAITGCYQDSGSSSFGLFVPFLLLFVFELGLALLTVLCAIQSWRTTSNPLLTVLLKHNVFYYACGLFFSAVNVLTLLFLHYAYHAMFEQLQIMILAILATRMHLHLWHAEQRRHDYDSENLLPIPMSHVPESNI
ncbi:hypothetical protein K503DRAFT_518193 [Rhizopogon vinicolor AM-OR11-026]|uniref:DUF6533 domain-containing protein n=1 Tax=Rhizopogon vinicolor AM-OR11-026 TaxID=1314800 RepID=A0A1B7MLP4_9AGAM|nr:hypothetical protein K503DRAFT_518193 [Rhizopogon vinicolor AM-OR11-026]